MKHLPAPTETLPSGVSRSPTNHHGKPLTALARLRGAAGRQIAKLTGKGYFHLRDCEDSGAGKSSSFLKRREMMLLTSAAVLAFAAPREASALPTFNDDTQALQGLINRYVEARAKIRELEVRQDELNELEAQLIPDPPPALCRRKADDRLFRFMGHFSRPTVAVGEPYLRNDIAFLSRKRMMRDRDIPIRPDGTDYAPQEVPPGRVFFEFNGRVVREPWPLAQARADSVVAAQKQWDGACDDLQERLGIPAVEDALDEAYDAMWTIEDEIEAFAPRSAEHLRLKAGFALEHLYCDGASAEHASDFFAWKVLRELAIV